MLSAQLPIIFVELRESLPEKGLANRQDLSKSYVPNGAIFVFKTAFLEARNGYYSDRTYPYVMPAERSVDIDDQHDFDLAEFLMGRLGTAVRGRS